jgi:hypothetical protein
MLTRLFIFIEQQQKQGARGFPEQNMPLSHTFQQPKVVLSNDSVKFSSTF